MSLADPNPLDIQSPVANPDQANVVAGEYFYTRYEDQRLLNNDQSGIPGAENQITVTYIGLSADDVNTPVTPLAILNSPYGDWGVLSDGRYAFTANGLASKNIMQGSSADAVLFYQIENSLGQKTISTVTMTVQGIYDPIEVSFGDLTNLHFDEDSWKQWIDQGNVNFSVPEGRVNFFEPQLGATGNANYEVICNSLEISQLFAAEIDDLKNQIHFTVAKSLEGDAVTFIPEYAITKNDVGFLREGDQITIKMYYSISDGLTTVLSPVSMVTIQGIEHPLIAQADQATVSFGESISKASSVSVLTNDVDADDQGEMKVFAIGNNSDMFEFSGQSSYQVSGSFGKLVMYDDGSYDYEPYLELAKLMVFKDDIFRYEVINGAGETQITFLTIHLLPNPAAIVLHPMTKDVFVLDESLRKVDGSGGYIDYGGGYTNTDIDSFSVDSRSSEAPNVVLNFMSLSIESHGGMFQPQTVSVAASESMGLIPLISPSETSLYAFGIWRTQYMLSLASVADFQFLNEGDQVKITYQIIAGSGGLFQQPQSFSLLIQGDNDAPQASEDANLAYKGQSVTSDFNRGGGLLGNDYDPDLGDHIRVVFISSDSAQAEVALDVPAEIDGEFGRLTVHLDGSYTYFAYPQILQQLPLFSGDQAPTYDEFTYVIEDDHGGVTTQKLRIEVRGLRDKPMAADDVITVNLTGLDPTAPVGNILDNDLDADPDRLFVVSSTDFPDNYLSLTEGGNLFINASAFDNLKYGQTKDLSFAYSASNGVAESENATVNVHITGSNTVPQPHSDLYFYENAIGSVFNISAAEGLIFHKDISDELSDADIDGDVLTVTAISQDANVWVSLVDGTASLTVSSGSSLSVHSDGSFSLDTSDNYRGVVSFWYLLSDGIDGGAGSASIDVGGPAPQMGQLLINEISLNNPILVRNAYTDNGNAPNRIQVGKASIELLNNSDESISAAQLSKMKLEITGSDDSALVSIDLGTLTGLTQDAGGNSLNKFFIPAGGVLMLYEPGSQGWGTWALYGPDKKFVVGGSGSYVGQGWPLGESTKDVIAVNLIQNETPIDLFAANGVDVSHLTGITELGDASDGDGAHLGVGWGGTDIGTPSGVQFDGSASDVGDTVFARTSLTDTNSERDWGVFSSRARTIGDINDKTGIFIANPEDPRDDMNPGQGLPSASGQIKEIGSGSLDGADGPDSLVGQNGDDNLSGDAGDDYLAGGQGADILDGGVGGDLLLGGIGADQQTGGSGDDVFVYAAVTDSSSTSRDTIIDFTGGQDVIDLSAIDADVNTPGNQSFIFAGSTGGRAQDASVTGKVVFWVENGMTVVQVDVAEDGLAPLELLISGTRPLQLADFVL